MFDVHSTNDLFGHILLTSHVQIRLDSRVIVFRSFCSKVCLITGTLINPIGLKLDAALGITLLKFRANTGARQ